MRVIDPSLPPPAVNFSTLTDGDGLTASDGKHGIRLNASQAYIFETNVIRPFSPADQVVKRVIDEVTFVATGTPAP